MFFFSNLLLAKGSYKMNKSRILHSYRPSSAGTSQLPEESFRQFKYSPFLLKGLLKEGFFHTIWGRPEEVTIFDNGLIYVSTSTHGGFFVPKSLRESLSSDHFLRMFENKFNEADQPWFEQDTDWALVALTFPDIFSRESFKQAEILAKNSFPEAYEQYIGRELLPGESRGKDQKATLHSIKDNVCIFEEFALDSPKAREIWPTLTSLTDQSKHLVCVKYMFQAIDAWRII